MAPLKPRLRSRCWWILRLVFLQPIWIAASIWQRDQREKRRHWMRVIPFARSTRALDDEREKPWKLRLTAGEVGSCYGSGGGDSGGGRVTARRDGAAGRADFGWQGEQGQHCARGVAGAAIGNRDRHLRAEGSAETGAASGIDFSLPSLAFTGEQFPIDLWFRRRRRRRPKSRLAAEGHALGKTTVTLEAGENPLRLHASAEYAGSAGFVRSRFECGARRGSFRSGGDAAAAESSVCISRTRGRWIRICQRRSKAAQFDVDRVNDFTSGDLRHYQLVIFNNWDLEAISPARKMRLRTT